MIRDDQKAYRQTALAKERRRLYDQLRRQRDSEKVKERRRAQARRDAPGGAELNRVRVKADRLKLGRHYLTALVRQQCGVPCRAVPAEVVAMKRDQITLRRLALEMLKAATEAKEKK